MGTVCGVQRGVGEKEKGGMEGPLRKLRDRGRRGIRELRSAFGDASSEGDKHGEDQTAKKKGRGDGDREVDRREKVPTRYAAKELKTSARITLSRRVACGAGAAGAPRAPPRGTCKPEEEREEEEQDRRKKRNRIPTSMVGESMSG